MFKKAQVKDGDKLVRATAAQKDTQVEDYRKFCAWAAACGLGEEKVRKILETSVKQPSGKVQEEAGVARWLRSSKPSARAFAEAQIQTEGLVQAARVCCGMVPWRAEVAERGAETVAGVAVEWLDAAKTMI